MRQPAPQWVNSFAIVLGGIAMFAPLISPYLGYLFINFLVMGVILGFLWPERSWRWGLWLAIPVLTVGIVNFADSIGVPELINLLANTGQAAIAGAIPGLLGARFSPRRLPFTGLH